MQIELLDETINDGIRKKFLAELHKHYPQWDGFWDIEANYKGGIVNVKHLGLDVKAGVVIYLTEPEEMMKNLYNFVSEMFERFGVSREKDADELKDLSNVKRNAIGKALEL